eukprot:NODE_363_length_1433_cov_311.753613_g267_i0.p1 GENE.NODE_363_length_1433_cov_311.753613_g267_i0~~NODE_363_length_1433_cov_311.753613_g267_i0.p1  ORF type:complete len:268 (-),score=130.58 NODE_363_length_1433_cov_311.753613_g267_i0:629-1402(-)
MGRVADDSSFVATASRDHSIILWDPQTGNIRKRLIGHGSRIRVLAISPDGSFLASGADDNTGNIWDTESGTISKRLKNLLDSTILGQMICVAIAPDNSYVITSLVRTKDDKKCILFDPRTGGIWRRLLGHHTATITHIVIAKDNSFIVTAGGNEAFMWDTVTSTVMKSFHAHTGDIRAVVLSPDNTFVGTASEDTTCCLWFTLNWYRRGYPLVMQHLVKENRAAFVLPLGVTTDCLRAVMAPTNVMQQLFKKALQYL